MLEIQALEGDSLEKLIFHWLQLRYRLQLSRGASVSKFEGDFNSKLSESTLKRYACMGVEVSLTAKISGIEPDICSNIYYSRTSELRTPWEMRVFISLKCP